MGLHPQTATAHANSCTRSCPHPHRRCKHQPHKQTYKGSARTRLTHSGNTGSASAHLNYTGIASIRLTDTGTASAHLNYTGNASIRLSNTGTASAHHTSRLTNTPHALTPPQGGIQQFPNCPYMRICYSSFLIDCRKQQLGGSAQLDLARKMYPNLSFRCACVCEDTHVCEDCAQKLSLGHFHKQVRVYECVCVCVCARPQYPS